MSDQSSPPDPPAEAPIPPPSPAQVPAIVPQAQSRYPAAAAGDYHPSDGERTMGMLIHLLAVLTGFIGVLVLWLVKRESSRFVDHNGKEAINFQITVLICALGIIFVGVLAALATEGVGALFVVPLYFALIVMVYVFEIMACIKANRGEWVRYPLCIRLIK